MKTAIIYAAKEAITPQHRFVLPTIRKRGAVTPSAGPGIFIRVELSNLDLSDALDNATTMKGEFVLNTIEIEE